MRGLFAQLHGISLPTRPASACAKCQTDPVVSPPFRCAISKIPLKTQKYDVLKAKILWQIALKLPV
jgi:hypothetical protein